MAECKSSDDAFVLAANEADPMNVVAVIQHTAGEYLGLMEDHFEGRRIRFQYFRPFAAGKLPEPDAPADALILLGGGPWGAASEGCAPLARSLAGKKRHLLRCNKIHGHQFTLLLWYSLIEPVMLVVRVIGQIELRG